MTQMKWHRAASHRWTPTTKHEPTPEEIRRAAARREQAKREIGSSIVKGVGIACPSCGRPTEMRSHATPPKKIRQYFYLRWFRCANPNCKETSIFRDEDRSDVQERMAKIVEQLKPRS